MVERIRNHRILRAQKRLEEPRVRVEATGKENRVLHPQKRAQKALQALVRDLRAANEAHRRHAEAVLAQGVSGCFDEERMVGQAQIVVRAQIDAGGAGLKRNFALLRRGDDLLLLEQTVVLQGLDACAEIGSEGSCHALSLNVHTRDWAMRAPLPECRW